MIKVTTEGSTLLEATITGDDLNYLHQILKLLFEMDINDDNAKLPYELKLLMNNNLTILSTPYFWINNDK
jgi:hypothetical protein